MVKNKGMYFQYFSLNWGTFIDTRCICCVYCISLNQVLYQVLDVPFHFHNVECFRVKNKNFILTFFFISKQLEYIDVWKKQNEKWIVNAMLLLYIIICFE